MPINVTYVMQLLVNIANLNVLKEMVDSIY